MKTQYIPTPTITDCRQLAVLHPGQWVQLAWCDHKSRLVKYTVQHTTMFHYPQAASRFCHYFKMAKAVDAFASFNRHAGKLTNEKTNQTQAA